MSRTWRNAARCCARPWTAFGCSARCSIPKSGSMSGTRRVSARLGGGGEKVKGRVRGKGWQRKGGGGGKRGKRIAKKWGGGGVVRIAWGGWVSMGQARVSGKRLQSNRWVGG